MQMHLLIVGCKMVQFTFVRCSSNMVTLSEEIIVRYLVICDLGRLVRLH